MYSGRLIGHGQTTISSFSSVRSRKFCGGSEPVSSCGTVSFLAIIPLAKLLALATDELSMRVGQTLAGLLNATLVRFYHFFLACLN